MLKKGLSSQLRINMVSGFVMTVVNTAVILVAYPNIPALSRLRKIRRLACDGHCSIRRPWHWSGDNETCCRGEGLQ